VSNPLPKVDVVIVGLGAAGGIASHVLTQAGLNVVGIEAGPYRTNADFIKQLDEIGGTIYNQLGPKYNLDLPTWRPNAQSPTQPPAIAIKMANGVGGTSVHYNAQSFRFTEDDFKIRSSTIDRYGEAAIPAGSTLVDWPVTYDELERYYDNVEYLIGVSGESGVNPFESPRSRDYPMPPLQRAGYGELMTQAMAKLGYHPYANPAAINSQTYGDRPACSYCGFCQQFGCWNDSKSSTLVTAIRTAEASGKLEIRANSRVLKVLSNDKGETTGVQYLDENGELQEQPAGVVILSSYIYENVRLLLLSSSDFYKDGLANNAGQVGKHFMSHIFAGRNALFSGQKLNVDGGLVSQSPIIDDLNGDNFDHTGLGFIRGSILYTLFGNLPISLSRTLPPGIPGWGSAYKQWLHDNVQSVGAILSQLENLPYEANFIDLDPDVKDPAGVPVARITYDLYDNEKRMVDFLTGKMDEILTEMGATQIWPGYPAVPYPLNSHAYGGARMGDDPANSVVNKFSLAHESPNLAVLGGATFCSTTGYNPTETIQALAWLSAEHIAEHFQTIAV
jgi:gluconate 2-dehydrogenase alpha chain